MSNFIELTRRGKRRVTLKNISPIWIQVDHIVSIHRNPHGGSFIALRVHDFWLGATTGIYVTAELEELMQLIRRTKSSPHFRCNMEFSEKAKSIICDQLCWYLRECKDEYELEARCEHCPLVELEDEFCE